LKLLSVKTSFSEDLSQLDWHFAPLFAYCLFFFSKIIYENGNLLCLITFSPVNTTITEKVVILMIYQGIPVFFGLLITIIGYGAAIIKVKRLPPDIAQQLGINVYRLLWYPAVLFITFLPGMIDNFLQIFLWI